MMNNIEAGLLENVNAFVGFARRRLGNAELAADVVQDSLLKALKATDQIRNEERQGVSLIFTVAVLEKRLSSCAKHGCLDCYCGSDANRQKRRNPRVLPQV